MIGGKPGLTILSLTGNVTELKANLAQLVEQVIRNDQVVGSSPTIGSSFFRRRFRQNIFTRAVNFVDTFRFRAKHLRVILMSLYRQAKLPIHRREFPRPLFY